MATERLVDAHVHVASADETRHPRTPSGVGSDWWRTPCGVDQLIEHMDGARVDNAVVVQAIGIYGYDCTCAAEAVAASGGRLSLVGAVDMTSEDVTTELEHLVTSAPVSGVRLFGVGASGSEWLTNGVGEAAWAFAADAGLVVVPTIFPDGLPALRTLIEQHPEVDVALDHCAFPDFGGDDAMTDLLAMADLPRLRLKVTSHNLDRDGDPAEFVDALTTAFGAARLCWGSDHPQHQSKTYAEMFEIAVAASRNLTPEERGAFLGGTALGLWWPRNATPPTADHPTHHSDPEAP